MSTASKILSQVDVPSVDPALLKICGVTEDPALCANSILPHLKGLVEPANVLKTEIEACVEEAKKAMAIIEKMGSEQSLSAPMSSAIDSCKETYTDLFDSLKSAKEAIFAHDIGTLTVMLSAVISDITTCDDGFVEMELPSPLEKLEVRTKVEKLAGNCLDMAKLVN
ncbi:pectinesterase inhibitor-like [Quillaja saponaria]|uniref:Pectinesterase inhibitor-like n=1 Tax=Quillaja saponaria TaxID=32244 RepID=A0AAD7Q9Z4_QUISA|nr:pectinesterase inhibitor-like [Quillaja saponaria]